MNYYSGKKVFVTGGSSGIGKACALMLAKWGAHVAIAARGQARLDETLAELKAAGTDAQTFFAISLDIADRDAVKPAAAAVVEALGGIDVVINNAGIAHPATVLNTPDDVFDSMMQVNYFGTVNVTRAFLPYLYEQKQGHVCMVASMLGFMGIYGYTAYAASKYAVTGFSDCLRQELLDHNIGITVVFPPDTDTPQLHEENKFKPPETKAIAGEVKTMSAEDVGLCALEAVAAGRYHVVPGAMGKFTYWMQRHFPSVVRFVIDHDLKKYRKKNPLAA